MARHAQDGIYGGKDPRILPAYSFLEGARYLRIPGDTLRNWCLGKGSARPIVKMDDPDHRSLSFLNLVEAHILTGLRSKPGVSARMIRTALESLRRRFSTDRPLIDRSFETDGRCFLIQELEGQIISTSEGHDAGGDLLPELGRIERDSAGVPTKLYPFTRPARGESPRIVVMNPLVSFGRPSVGGVPTSEIMSRFRAGDSPSHLSRDYGLQLEEVEEALRCEAA